MLLKFLHLYTICLNRDVEQQKLVFFLRSSGIFCSYHDSRPQMCCKNQILTDSFDNKGCEYLISIPLNSLTIDYLQGSHNFPPHIYLILDCFPQ